MPFYVNNTDTKECFGCIQKLLIRLTLILETLCLTIWDNLLKEDSN